MILKNPMQYVKQIGVPRVGGGDPWMDGLVQVSEKCSPRRRG